MFAQYPYLNLNDFNLDYILNAIKDMRNEVTNFVSINAVKYADPIQWNITRQYEKNTIVIDPVTGTAYISVAPVPAGVALTRPEYWTVVFDLGSFVTRAAKNFTTRYEQDTTTTATFNSVAGDWLVWGDTLYVANVNITAGDSYVVDGNIRHITVEEVKNTIMQLIADNYNAIINMIGSLDDLTTTDKTSIVNAINTLVSALDNEVRAREDADDSILSKIGNLEELPTTIKTNIVASISELYTDIQEIPRTTAYTTPEEHGAVGDGITDDTAAINSAFQAENIVVLKKGATYLVTDRINIPDNGRLIGNGATIKVKDNTVIRYVEGTDPSIGVITINGVKNVSIENVVIDANGSTLPLYSTYENVDNVAIAIEDSADVFVKNCKLLNLYTEGIDTHRTTGDIVIEHNYFKHIQQNQGLRKDCIYCVSHSDGTMNVNNNICDEDAIDNQYGCGGIFFATVRNAICSGNIVLNCGRRNVHAHPVSAICVYSECVNIDVHDNYIRSIEGIFRADASAKISFRNNYCSFSGSSGYSDSDYIRITFYDPSYLGYWGEHIIEGNTIIIDDTNRGAARGIGVGHNISRPLRGLRIANNVINMSNDAIAIYCEMNDIHITNNYMLSPSSDGHPDIKLTNGGNNIFITNNTCHAILCEREAGAAQVCYHLIIANNSCLSNGGSSIKVDNTSYGVVHDNNMAGKFEAGSGIYSVIVHDNVAHDSSTGYGYYGSVTGQHDNYYNNALVSSFQS